MRKIILCFLFTGMLYTTTCRAQHNTCHMAETVLDSLAHLHASYFPDMKFYTDTSTLAFPASGNEVYTDIMQSKRPLRAIKTEPMHVNSCTFTRIKLTPNINPDSVSKYVAYAIVSSNKKTTIISDVGVRFSHLHYSSDLALGYMQLNLRTETLFYYFIFEKDKKSGNWVLIRLVQKPRG